MKFRQELNLHKVTDLDQQLPFSVDDIISFPQFNFRFDFKWLDNYQQT